MDLNTVTAIGSPADIMSIVRKLRSEGLIDGKDFGFGRAYNGYNFWFKDTTWIDYIEKRNTFVRIAWK